MSIESHIRFFIFCISCSTSDFLVNEVDFSGTILHLTQPNVTPDLFKDDPVADDSLDAAIKEKIKAFLSSTESFIQIPASQSV